MIVAGIDIGAKTVKAVAIDEERHILGTAVVKTRPDFPAVAREVLDAALSAAGGGADGAPYTPPPGSARSTVPSRARQVREFPWVREGPPSSSRRAAARWT